MTVITGGLVAYEDGIKAAEEYAPAKKIRVELRFDVEEGGDSQAGLDMVGDIARAKVEELLHRKEAAVRVVGGAAVRTKADLAAEAGVAQKAEAVVKPKKAPKAEATKKDPDELDVKESVVRVEESFDVVGEEVTQISDADLATAAGKTNARIDDAQQIRDLVATYNPEAGKPFQMRQIPQEKRAEFVAKLGALKKKDTPATK